MANAAPPTAPRVTRAPSIHVEPREHEWEQLAIALRTPLNEPRSIHLRTPLSPRNAPAPRPVRAEFMWKDVPDAPIP